MSNIIDKIQLSGVTYDIGGGGSVSTAITSGDTNAVAGGAVYDKFDEVEQVTAQALNVLNESLSGKQDTLSAGTGIDITSNVISVTGSTGGKAIEAGRGISVTTGATADTISVSLPISAGTGSNSIVEGQGTAASGKSSHAEGTYTKASGQSSHAEGSSTKAYGTYSHAEGINTRANGSISHAEGDSTQANGEASHAEGHFTNATNESEHASGRYNVSSKANTTFGNSGNTLFSVGNGIDANNRHNAFEIRQNGDIYLSSGGTDIKLQDHLGGGSSYSAGTGIDITNSVISISLPISAGTGSNSIIEGYTGNTASGEYSHAEGYNTTASTDYVHAEGYSTKASGLFAHAEGGNTSANGTYSHAEGNCTITTNKVEHASGQFNTSNKANTTFGDSGNTLFSVGNGTANNARHNAFEIRQNGDIYISSGGTDIKLQDHLGGGGGGSSYTAGDGIDITNDVISVTGKVDTATYNTYTAATDNRLSEDEEVTAAAFNNLNEALSGKQDTLSAGTNITIVDNVISAEGGSITIDPSLDTGSTNAVANSAITTAINAVSGAVPTQYVKKIVQNSDNGVVRFYDVWKESGYAFPIYNFSINGKMVLSKQNGTYPGVYNFNLVETSAITTSISSSSTDAQVPSAKAVNDKLGGLSLVKLTQAQYDNLQNKDSNTLYVIVN